MSKTYSVSEVDDLRRVLRCRELYGTTDRNQWPRVSRSFNDVDLSAIVEQRVQTAMFAGHVAQDFIDADLHSSQGAPHRASDKG